MLAAFNALSHSRGETFGGVVPTMAILAYAKDVLRISDPDELDHTLKMIRAIDDELMEKKPKKGK